MKLAIWGRKKQPSPSSPDLSFVRQVMSVEDDLLDELEAEIARTTGFKVTDHEVKLYGYCKECGGNLIEKNKTSE